MKHSTASPSNPCLPLFTPEVENEIWLPIPEYEAYYSISSLGRIRRDAPGKTICKVGRILKLPDLTNRPARYQVIHLFGESGHHGWYTVHSLVAKAFLGPRTEGIQVNHKDGNRVNNRVSNLEYVTPRENHRHASVNGIKASGSRHGAVKHPETRPRGVDHGRSSFTEDQIRDIRKRRSDGVPLNTLAAEYGRHREVIGRIARGRAWMHVK